jgi:hypothetical protein
MKIFRSMGNPPRNLVSFFRGIPSRKNSHWWLFLTIVIFFLSLFIHTRGLNLEGRTWDEEYKIETGRIAFRNILYRQWQFKDWGYAHEHPMFAKYLYGLAATPHYYHITDSEFKDLNSRLITSRKADGILKVLDYDWTSSRFLSAVFSSGTVALTFLIATHFLSWPLSAVSALILLTTPRFLAMGRLVTFESLSGLLFLLTIFFGYRLSQKAKFGNYLLTALFSALLFWTRYNNLYIYLWLLVWLWLLPKETQRAILNRKLLLFPIVWLILGIFCWPLWWLNFPQGLFLTFSAHQTRPIASSFYYSQYFLYTTPLAYLLLMFGGIISLLKNKTGELKILLWQLVSLLVFFTLICSATGGTRYIYLIYPGYAIMSALGLNYLLSGSSKNSFFGDFGAQNNTSELKKRVLARSLKLLILFGLGSFFLINIYRTIKLHPYYLDYYNELVGGLKGAKEKKLEISWWGEGQREAGVWLNNHITTKTIIALCLTPRFVFPPLKANFQTVACEKMSTADLAVVGYNDQKIISNLNKWQKIYEVKREGVGLITIYKNLIHKFK